MNEPHNKSEDWRTLSELASKEKDPVKLRDLIERLNRALDKRWPTRTQTVGLA